MSGVPSLISSDIIIKGTLHAAGEVQLDGSMEGDVHAIKLIIGEKAAVKGEIVCEEVTVRGRVEGGIRARQVQLASTSHIEGDILHSALSVETGAYFEGNCRHSDDPLSDEAAKDFRKPAPAPAPRPSTPSTDKPTPSTPKRNPLLAGDDDGAVELDSEGAVEANGAEPDSPLRSKPKSGLQSIISKGPLR